MLGLKYTTARGVAQHTVDAVARSLKVAVRPSRTASTTLPGAGIADHEALAIETARELHLDVPLPTLRHLTARYAERASDIVRLMKPRLDAMAPLDISCATTGAEVLHVIRHEMAVHLTDIVIRRTALGAAGHPGGRGRGRVRRRRRARSWGGTRSASSTRCGRSTRSIRSDAGVARRATSR